MAAVPAAAPPPLLELRDVDAAYGPFRAIFGVSLTLQPGRVLAVSLWRYIESCHRARTRYR